VHEDYPQQALSKHYLPPFLRRAAACLAAALERAAGAAFATVVAATDTIAARFPGPKTVVIRNYPAPPSAHGLRLTANGQSPESEGCRPSAVSCTPFGRFRLVHLAGTLTHVRGITSMVRAMDFLDDSFELVLAGRFEPAEYGAVLGRLPGYARVRHIRNVPHPDVWSLYRRCHVGLVCSLPLTRHLFALPVKLFEFMAAGLPVVVSDFPLLRAIVEENDCGIPVNPEDPGAIAAAVRRLARDPALARRLGENGIRAVATTFNWEREAAVLLRSYARLGARLPAPGSPRMTCRSTSSTASIPHSALPR